MPKTNTDHARSPSIYFFMLYTRPTFLYHIGVGIKMNPEIPVSLDPIMHAKEKKRGKSRALR